MTLIQTAIERPIAVIAGMLMIVLFGVVALKTIPIQLAPDVERPVITITTKWPAAAPAEIEREILNRQETVFAGLEGLVSITGSAQLGRSRLTLEFSVDTDMNRALLLVANRLDRVNGYPDEAQEPTLKTTGTDDNAIAWFTIQRVADNPRPIHEYSDFIDDVIKERLERVPGIGEVNYYGGTKRQIQIIVDPQRLARYRLTIGEMSKALRDASVSLSAGSVDEGKRRYTVRAEGELSSLTSIREVLIRSIEDPQTGRFGRVSVNDIAEVRFGYETPVATIRVFGQPAMAMNATRRHGANVIETMARLQSAVNELNETVISDAGLVLRQVYNETVYINSAIRLVQQNIWVGGVLAGIILLLFLRSLRATIIISIAIPVSVIGAFVAMALLGRSLNVISLAGIAFSVGMVVDAAIVVLENIFRLREQGQPIRKAALEGTKQVWGAVLVSALTTVMVFIPILTIELEAGQLFRDIAVAISIAVILSLLVSITLIPALSARLLKPTRKETNGSPTRIDIPVLDSAARLFAQGITIFCRVVAGSPTVAIAVVGSITAAAAVVAWLILPQLEYLPEGNRNLLFGAVTPPPGYNLETVTRIAKSIEDEISPYWSKEGDALGGADSAPQIERFFSVATPSRTFFGAVAADPTRVRELEPILRGPVFREPGTFGFISQPSIFGRGIGGSRKIDLDISGPELETILSVANRAFRRIMKIMPRKEGHQWRPNPGLELGAPEIQLVPNRLRLSDADLSAKEVAETIDVFNDGRRVLQVTVGGKLTDLVLKGKQSVNATQDIGELPVVLPTGHVVPVKVLTQVALTAGPTQIRHRERLRTITLDIRPAPGIPLEAAITRLREEVIRPLRTEGLPPQIKMRLTGTADKLIETRDALSLNMVLALAIVYLVMAVLFESFIYPLIIMLAVPVAAVGGIGGLAALNLVTYQALDMLTMLGFVILIGIVVNNAILLVHQTLFHFRTENTTASEAIVRATRNRIRPIFMSTLTSVFGMLPLALFPGAGSELYRGLGSVIIGGLMLSAIITLLIIPPMMAMIVAPLEARRAARSSSQ
ncbi:MAG: efflux RND transporter permease subunit [Arenicellales bacterium]|nr:efflux RND transporter permease subunit [Arenicellales bacterium]